MPAVLYFVCLLAGASILMTLVWVIQRRTHNAGWVDVAWSASLGALALVNALTGSGAFLPRLLLGLFAGIWALRLAGHLAIRVAGEAEDGRYRAMREHWGEGTQVRMFLFFQAQAVVAVLMSIPFWAVVQNPVGEWNPWFIAALVVWLISIGGEALADRQLQRFKANPDNQGRTCRAGLWGWSRHPNYFFEWLHWFSYVLLGFGAPLWWLTWVGPVLMFAFLYRLTGIPYTENRALRHRSDYREYQQAVSAFIPWPPSK